MGKALIVSHKGEGLYKAKLQPDRSAYDRHHARLVENIAKVTDMLAALALQISDAESFENGANEELQNAIVNQSANLPTLEKEWLETLNTLQGLYQTRSRLTLQRAALQLRLDELEKSAPKDAAEVDLWCADYSEDLTGEVGTIEPAGDSSLGVILRPGQRDPAFNPLADGTLRDSRHMSAAEVFWNAAMLPGWQKWTPTYRIGTITALNGDSCDVTLEAVQSDAKGLNVNQSGTLTGVGVDYMDCHGAAFEVGDTVVVMFQGQEWANPQVIGFEKEPRACTIRGLQINDNGLRKYLKWSATANQWTSAAPVSSGLLFDVFTATNAARAANGGLRSFLMPSGYNVNPAQTICDLIRDTGIGYTLGYLPHESELYPVGQQTVAERVDPYIPNVTSFAENLLGVPKFDPDTGAEVAELSGAELVDLWMNSPGHRANILGTDNPQLNERPTILFIGRSEDAQMRYYAQLIATLASLTGDIQGNIDWQGNNGLTLTWRGLPNRYGGTSAPPRSAVDQPVVGQIFAESFFYGTIPPTVSPVPRWHLITEVKKPLPAGMTFGELPGAEVYDYVRAESLWSGRIFKGGRVIATFGQHISGACLSGGKLVAIFTEQTLGWEDVTGQGAQEYIVWADANGENPRPRAALMTLGRYERTPWFFNASGTEGVAIRDFHKWTISLDPATETYTLTDHGLCSFYSYTDSGRNGTITVTPATTPEGNSYFQYSGGTSSNGTIMLQQSLFDYIGDRMVELRYSRNEVFSQTRTVTPSGTDIRNEAVSQQSATVTISYDGQVIATGSSSSDSIEAQDSMVASNLRNQVASSYSSDLPRPYCVDLRTGLIAAARFSGDESFDLKYGNSGSVNYTEHQEYDLSLPGRFNTKISRDIAKTASSPYSFEDLFPYWNYGETTTISNPGSSGTLPAVGFGLNEQPLAGCFAKEPTTGKLAISILSKFDGTKSSTPYHYLEGGNLAQHTSTPCNPICAV